ncbi:MAG: hypothetical protein ACE5H1_09040, partial [Thermodesulfobacteriota bacterium]
MKLPAILMIVENFFPQDTRVFKEANSLKKDYRITVIALKKKSEKFYEMRDNIQILRIPEIPKFRFEQNNILSRFFNKTFYILHYLFFTISSAILFLCTHIINKYCVIHAHNPPDTLFLIGFVAKFFSVK